MKAFTRLLLIGLLATPAYAQDPATSTDTAKTPKAGQKEKLSAGDLQIMAHYEHVNMMEIDLGKMAEKQAGTPAVKQYAAMLVKDHTQGDKELKALAKQTGQTIPAEKPMDDAEKTQMADMKKKVAALKKMKGAEFDHEYLTMMVDGHEKELAKIDTNISSAQNAQLQDQLKQLKPMLQHHADEAKELQKASPTAMDQGHQTHKQ